jgi:NAD(P)-dependent dehydrogenase (short-subunit alcohol dehydrogenase family)
VKAILITGAGSGIGRATAQLFAARGWRIGVADVSESGIRETLALLPADRAHGYPMDVRSVEDWEEVLAAFTAASGGRLDVLMNNAGIAAGGPFAEIAPDALDRVIDVNFRGVAYGARIAHAYLEASGGVLLNTASASAIYGSAGLAAYSATKFAVRGLTEALDAEWAADGIKVRDLLPGFIDTPLLDIAVPGTNTSARDAVREAGLEFTPVEEVAEAAWRAVHGEAVHT